MKLIREMPDGDEATALSDAINALSENPFPSEARQVLEDVPLYLLRVGRHAVTYNIDFEERVVNVRNAHVVSDA